MRGAFIREASQPAAEDEAVSDADDEVEVEDEARRAPGSRGVVGVEREGRGRGFEALMINLEVQRLLCCVDCL